MLRRFLYLDRAALAQYIGALEGGSLTSETRRVLLGGKGSAGIDVKVVKGQGEKSSEEESSLTLSDTDEARFDKLLKAASDDPDALGWVDITQPDTEFPDAGIGAMVSWECDVYVPEFVQMIASSGEMLGMIEMAQQLMPAASALGLDMGGLPDERQLTAMSTFLSGMDQKLLIVGEDDDTDWKIAGRVDGESELGGFEGRAHVVGKISKVVPDGHWQPFLTFPGMNLVSREQRRALAKKTPEQGEEGQYLEGPALMLHLLAVYL